MTGYTAPGTEAYSIDHNETATLAKVYTSADWETDNGWNEINHEIKNMESDFYVRIRGTNHLPGTPFETDTNGNPLADSLSLNLNLNGEAEAWADLWFYSNPIFLDLE